MPSRALVVYYTRTGTTGKVAREIAEALGADSEQIRDKKDKSGLLSAIRSGKNIFMNKLIEIEQPVKDPSNYDLIVIGTPLIFNEMPLQVRAYITKLRHKFKNVAFFCVGGIGSKNLFKDMAYLCGKQPLATLSISHLSLFSGRYKKKISDFTKALR